MIYKQTIELISSGKLSRRQMTKVLASVGVGLVSFPALSRIAGAESVNLKLLEWSGYEAPPYHPEYTAKYGGEPESTFFGESEDAFQKMKAGYKVDLVHPCTAEVNMFRDAGLIKPIETDRIPRWKDIIPSLLDVKGVQSQGHVWFVPWDWGFSTVGYNPKIIDVEKPTFSIFVDPKYKGKVALNSQMSVNIVMAGVIGGWKKPLDPTEEEMKMAPEIFTKMLENARFIWSDNTQLDQAWAAGDVGASYIYGSSIKKMKDQGIPVEIIDPVLPWMCGFCVSANADGSEDQAYDYINAMLDPAGGKAMVETLGYGHANAKTFEQLDPAMLKEKGLDDPIGLLSKGIFFDEVPPEKNDKLNAMWQEAQAGLN